MNILKITDKKRLGKSLTYDELEYAFTGYLKEKIPDYQMSSLLMAIVIKGMTLEETINLTDIFIKSGEIYDLSNISDCVVDKHSTGGVGDTTSIIVGPIVASCNVKMAKMSGRGLGITGGTIDKLESIPKFNVNLTKNQFYDALNNVGFVDSAQTDKLVPLDKQIYSLRNITGTTESLPLIVSSIMSKKIAGGANIILIDIKVGSGALIKTKKDANLISSWMKEIGKKYNRKVITIVSDMNVPLSNSIGNALEVEEAISVLKGKKNKLYDACIEISSILIALAKKISVESAKTEAINSINNKIAYKKFKEFVSNQNGDLTKFKVSARYTKIIRADKSGVLTNINAKKIGELSCILGAGKITKNDKIDYSAGIKLFVEVGETIKKGKILATLYTNKNIKLSSEDINCFEIKDV